VAESSLPVISIRPPREWVPLDMGELWEYRDLLYLLTWRNLKVRYKQTVLGGAWAIIQPLTGALIFSVIFGHLAKLPSQGIPYPLFAYCGLVPWTYFSNSVTQASNSLVENERMIKNVYFPRIFVPVSAILSNLLDLFIALLVLLAMMIYYGVSPSPLILLTPLFTVLVVITALGASVWLSAFNVMYRDVRYAVPFLIQIWLFLSPVAYSSSLIPERWQTIYALNPMAGVVDGFRTALLGQQFAVTALFLVSILSTVLLTVAGLYYFQRVEQAFADVV
jgi:lipopolysaccharide transport system permease protein